MVLTYADHAICIGKILILLGDAASNMLIRAPGESVNSRLT